MVGSMPSGGGWLYEIKFDGYCAVAAQLAFYRGTKDLGDKFPEVKDSIAAEILTNP
jgi:ATP-dependent DNA ligase